MTRIMGIDPSMTGCGLALIVDGKLSLAQTISTPADWTRGHRLEEIETRAESFLLEYHADHVAMEGYAFASKYNREEMGEVGGVLKAMLYHHGFEPTIWANASWKKTVLVNGKLPKDEVRLAVFQRYNVAIKDMNQVEAFCVAMAEYLAQSGAPRPKPKPKRKPKVASDE